jgi:hypothetical protein
MQMHDRNISDAALSSFNTNILSDKQCILQIAWKHTKYLIIDEASMLGAHFLHYINERLAFIRNERQLLFGGLNVIFFGDFFQFPPFIH